MSCLCLCLLGAPLVLASPPTQAHVDPVVCAGTAAGVCREAEAILYQERKWGQDTAH